jgi:hypothetical protein
MHGFDPDWAQVERRTLNIASQAITSLIQTQGVGDLYRSLVAAQRDGVDYNLAYIPETFTTPLQEPFDPMWRAPKEPSHGRWTLEPAAHHRARWLRLPGSATCRL